MLGTSVMGSGLLEIVQGIGAALTAAQKFAFFSLIFDWIDEEISVFRDNLLGSMAGWVGGIAFVLLTLWMLLQGYRIVTGQSKQFMMELVVKSLKWVLIITVATTFALGSSNIHQLLTDDMPRVINELVTGDNEGPEDAIDDNLRVMELALVSIDALDAGLDATLESAKTRAQWFTGIGVAGPSLVGGAILLMYKMALALFVGFGPFFILSLGFEQTKGMFQKWVWYGIGTMFSLAVLAFVIAMISKLLGAVAVAFAVKYIAALATQTPMDGVSTYSLQQGGLGILMTMFMVSVPPMAAAFFQGTLAHVSPYNALNSPPPPGAGAPGTQQYVPPQQQYAYGPANAVYGRRGDGSD